jgi:hypothetical protein
MTTIFKVRPRTDALHPCCMYHVIWYVANHTSMLRQSFVPRRITSVYPSEWIFFAIVSGEIQPAVSARRGMAGGACGMTNEDHAGRGRCCPRGSDIVGNKKLAIAGAEATEVRFTTRSVAINDVDGGNCDVDGSMSLGGMNKPAWPPGLSSSAFTWISVR